MDIDRNKSILVSSDHHANWEALEKLFQLAHKEGIPFVINGDVVGDYNFEFLAEKLELKFPYEIEEEFFAQEFDMREYRTYEYVERSGGNVDSLLHNVSPQHKSEARKQIEIIMDKFDNPETLKRIADIKEKVTPLVDEHKYKLRALYATIIKEHAQRLAAYIDKYNVPVYFLLGNHEPVYFIDFVKHYLTNKDLFTDIGSARGILTLHDINIVGVSNVNAIMPFLSDIYTDKEIDMLFCHQRGERNLLHGNVTLKTLSHVPKLTEDQDWIRVVKNGSKPDIDIFLSHGQIGRGAWRSNKFADEVPTLAIAATFSHIAHLTIDGHLHTSHEMKNSLGKQTIRAVGNEGYIISKDANKNITYEKVSVDAPYNARGGLSFEDLDFQQKVMEEAQAHFSVSFP